MSCRSKKTTPPRSSSGTSTRSRRRRGPARSPCRRPGTRRSAASRPGPRPRPSRRTRARRRRRPGRSRRTRRRTTWPARTRERAQNFSSPTRRPRERVLERPAVEVAAGRDAPLLGGVRAERTAGRGAHGRLEAVGEREAREERVVAQGTVARRAVGVAEGDLGPREAAVERLHRTAEVHAMPAVELDLRRGPERLAAVEAVEAVARGAGRRARRLAREAAAEVAAREPTMGMGSRACCWRSETPAHHFFAQRFARPGPQAPQAPRARSQRSTRSCFSLMVGSRSPRSRR